MLKNSSTDAAAALTHQETLLPVLTINAINDATDE